LMSIIQPVSNGNCNDAATPSRHNRTAEDSTTTCKDLGHVLGSGPGSAVDSVGAGSEALELLPERPYSLVGEMREELKDGYSFHSILSKNPRMHAIFKLIGAVAQTATTVLIEGATGTGKELVARAIHQASSKRSGSWIAVNCAAVPETLLESELFGHEKGAFTGAVGRRQGRFELANSGTIFLDEVGDVPAAMQAKLLRVLQERCFERVGGMETLEVDVRVIAASNRTLKKMVRRGTF